MPYHILWGYGFCQILRCHIAQICNFCVANLQRLIQRYVVVVGGADQQIVLFIGNGENHAPVSILKHVGALVGQPTFDHDMTAAD